ncbi:DUF262 domain-containing protein [Amphritea sp. 2_MG-2023]|uniref:DUF262 domain-containing protein n=1 Tax=Amphritea TaxID=515417 RepID=UPI001C06BB22|nr:MULTISPECIES: DUF262 domain-containing protein [Amphritea]MBU2965438.1 DUF262 domain-containing protein [Amphritea atlantica]MDO6418594.1 DUF262 domain-containing protein [Amphritea sp. 2_MG-2023]
MTQDKDLFEIDDDEVTEWFDSEDETSTDPIPEEVSLETKYSESQLRVVRTSMDFTLYHLKQSLEDREYINASPKYQRRHRWDIKKRSQLIESFLMNIPVPSVFLFENDYNQYEIMDGRQRIDTLRSFMNNEFPLKNLEFWKELEGLRFYDLPTVIQRGLSRRTINAIVLLAETTKEDSTGVDIRKILFKRLNTGGVQLNPQELRNALYPGEFNDLIGELSRYDTFTKIWKIPPYTEGEEAEPSDELLKNSLYKSMADCELVLRFFGIQRLIATNLGGSLRSILDKTSKAFQFIKEEEKENLAKEFKSSIDGLYEIFGELTFRIPSTGKLSRPMYDAFMVAYSLIDTNMLKNRQDINSILADIDAHSKEYEILIGKGNTADSIRDRVNFAQEILIAE